MNKVIEKKALHDYLNLKIDNYLNLISQHA